MKKITGVVVLLLCAFFLTSCNTVKGVGQDLQQGGQSLEKAATKKHK